MTEIPFSLAYISGMIDRVLSTMDWHELTSSTGDAFMPLQMLEDAQPAGYVRLWRGAKESPLDRMVHLRLIAGPVETQLLFIFGRSATSMPHLHAQVVQFPPDGCVYNMDYLPRLDPVERPDWFERVFSALRKPYRKATADSSNSCAQAPANPALAVYMSPWGIASGRADKDELMKVSPCLELYLDHYLQLASENGWEEPDNGAMTERDRRHLELFFDDDMDPRAWNGVYRVIGEEQGRAVKALFETPLGDQQ
ncbi:MAG: hypothetical protein E2O50_07215 [Gammaproteobacteria bacterium]|nr:MAG: hypothetical protein E2O50_07215 [Gammaproteobacteria bacterium]